MNKKLITIAGTIAVGTVMLGASAYAAISGTSGYDVYKQAIKNTYAVHSITPKTEAVVKDNGSVLFKVDSVSKIDKDSNTMSTTATVAAGDLQESVAVYNQAGQVIYKDSSSDVYNVLNSGKRMRDEKEPKVEKNLTEKDAGRVKDIENVADALAGNLQNYITLNTNTDGTKEVSLNLSENQVSPVANAIASLLIKNMDKENGKHQGFRPNEDQMMQALQNGLKDKLPTLVDNIKVTQVAVDASITQDNMIAGQTENLTVTGTDAGGKTHQLTVSVSTDFSGYNSTVPDKVDLSGKQVKQMDNEKRGHEE